MNQHSTILLLGLTPAMSVYLTQLLHEVHLVRIAVKDQWSPQYTDLLITTADWAQKIENKYYSKKLILIENFESFDLSLKFPSTELLVKPFGKDQILKKLI
jgi:hypothetical protein